MPIAQFSEKIYIVAFKKENEKKKKTERDLCCTHSKRMMMYLCNVHQRTTVLSTP